MYYRIFDSSDKKIVGKYPQISSFEFLTTWDSPNALGMLWFEKAKSNIEIRLPRFAKNAKLTDLVSHPGGSLLLVSEKLKNILAIDFCGVEYFETGFFKNGLIKKRLLLYQSFYDRFSIFGYSKMYFPANKYFWR